MRTISYRIGDLNKAVIHIGRVAENDYTRVQIDAGEIYADYPNASVSLTVQPPAGEAYPAVVTRDGNMVVWDVPDSALTAEGSGEIQLTFTADEVVVKSAIGRISVCRSILGNGEIPDPLEDFLAEAGAALTAIPETIDTALAEAKASGEFDGADGRDGTDGQDGADGFSPVVAVESITGGHSVSVTDAGGTQTFNVMDGADGQDGHDGQDGQNGVGVPTGGTTGQVLSKKSGTDYDTEWTDPSGGGGGTTDYNDLSNKPQIGGTTLSGNKTLSDLGIASTSDVSAKYTKPGTGIPSTDLASGVQTSLGKADSAYQKPSGGIPSTDMASGVQTSLGKADSAYQKPSGGIPSSDMASAVQTSLGKADTAYQKPSGGIPASDIASGVIPTVPVTDVQVNGTSVLSSGVANVPVHSIPAGGSSGQVLAKSSGTDYDAGWVTPSPVETVSGTTPSITGVAGTRYVCGECSTLSVQAPASGIIDVIFNSGSTATVLTVTSAKSGVTAIKWANGFDPSSLSTSTTYELNIMDGEYGVVGSWT